MSRFGGMSYKEKADLVANDPVTCARYFDRRFKGLVKAVLIPSHVIGEVTDYAGVDEFQQRGTPKPSCAPPDLGFGRATVWCRQHC
jgi:hypothetical protein